jgi:hypothetical protein
VRSLILLASRFRFVSSLVRKILPPNAGKPCYYLYSTSVTFSLNSLERRGFYRSWRSGALSLHGAHCSGITGKLPEDIESSEDQRQNLRKTHSVEPFPLHDHDLPVHKAAYKSNNAEVTSLITSSVNINARSIFKCTPLQLAIRGDHAETVRILLSAGADPALPNNIEPYMIAPFDAINGAAWLGARHALGALINFRVKTPSSALY